MFPIDVVHVPGVKMELLDHGSRYPISIGQHKEFEAEAGTLGICHRSNRVSPMESCDVKDPKVELLAAMALQDEDYRKDVDHVKNQSKLREGYKKKTGLFSDIDHISFNTHPPPPNNDI